MCSQVECFQDLPMHHLHHFCSTALGSVHSIWKVSCSHRCGWKSLAGLLDREHRLIRDDLRVEQIVLVVSLISREENVLETGRAEETREEKWVEEVLQGLQ